MDEVAIFFKLQIFVHNKTELSNQIALETYDKTKFNFIET